MGWLAEQLNLDQTASLEEVRSEMTLFAHNLLYVNLTIVLLPSNCLLYILGNIQQLLP